MFCSSHCMDCVRGTFDILHQVLGVYAVALQKDVADCHLHKAVCFTSTVSVRRMALRIKRANVVLRCLKCLIHPQRVWRL